MISLMNKTTPLLKGIQNSSFQTSLQNELLPICTDIYYSSGHGEIETSLLVKSIGAAFILALSSTVTLLALPSSSSLSRGDCTIILRMPESHTRLTAGYIIAMWTHYYDSRCNN